MQNVVMHIDMNSYFASVEQQDNLAWRGKPVGVCEHLGGIIIAASIEAKKWCIKTGTPVWEARKLYPKIILTHTRPEAYRKYNHRLVKLVSDYTDDVEVYSIDEVFLDITRTCNIRKNFQFSIFNFQSNPNFQFLKSKKSNPILFKADPYGEAVRIALEIKKRMRTEVGDWLTCSVGIGENKLLAKIGSDMMKPDGIVIIRNCHSERAKRVEESFIDRVNVRESLRSFHPFDAKRAELGRDGIKKNYLEFTKDDLYQKLKLIDIPGIGHRMEKRLNDLGIKTLLDLKNYPKSRLVSLYGPITGHHIYNMGQLCGSFKAEVEQDEKIKSMGHMYTLPQEYREKKFFTPVLYKLSEMVGRRLRQQNLMGNILYFHAHDIKGNCFGESKKLGYFVWDGRSIFLEAMRIFESESHQSMSVNKGNAGFKLIGITVAGLRPKIHQLSLFGEDEKNCQLLKALDKINKKYGDFTVCRVPVILAGKVFSDSIGFGRIKENLKQRLT